MKLAFRAVLQHHRRIPLQHPELRRAARGEDSTSSRWPTSTRKPSTSELLPSPSSPPGRFDGVGRSRILERGISKLRNPVIGRVFHALGLIGQWGSGVQRMTVACREAGQADPRFEEIVTRFRVTILTSRTTRIRLARLVGNWLVREVGSLPQDPKRRYFLARNHH